MDDTSRSHCGSIPAAEVRRVITARGLSIKDVAKHFRVHFTAVYAWRRHGMVFRPGLSRVRPEAWDAFALGGDANAVPKQEVIIRPAVARLPAIRTRLSIKLPKGQGPLGGFATLPAGELARMCGVKPSTAKRWRRCGKAPAAIVTLLEFFHHGPLGMVSPAWAGWHIRDGKLGTPEGMEFSPGEIRAIPIRQQQIAGLEATIRQLQDDLARTREFRMANSISETGVTTPIHTPQRENDHDYCTQI